MTYVYETKINDKDIWCEYVYSSVTKNLKVIEMSIDGEFHRFNWMNKTGQAKLMAGLETEMIDRICVTDFKYNSIAK